VTLSFLETKITHHYRALDIFKMTGDKRLVTCINLYFSLWKIRL